MLLKLREWGCLVACLSLWGSGDHFPQSGVLPASTLRVWSGGQWVEWWNSSAAPDRWNGPLPVVARALQWRMAAPGVQWTDIRIAGREEAWRIRVIVARIDPRVVRFRIDTAFQDHGAQPAWAVERARSTALVAVNVGQFPRTLPWGWVVLDGHEYLRPGVGPLSVGVAFDSDGGVRWIPGDSLGDPATRRGAVAAFQSYPALLTGGDVPPPLRREDRGVDLAHRDARAAIGQLADGSILIAITRFDGAGGVLDFLPFGLTTPEMAAVMGALGARVAVMLDGGISSQLLIRDRATVHRWKGLRRVPLGLVVVAR